MVWKMQIHLVILISALQIERIDGLPAYFSHQNQQNALFSWINVSPTILEKSGDYLAIDYSLGVHDPVHNFWLGAYLEGEDYSTVFPVKYKPISSVTIQGQTSIQLQNLRKGYTIMLMSGPPDSARPIARSKTIIFRSFEEPTQLHVSLTGRPTELRVSWTTIGFDSRFNNSRSDPSEQLVQYGLSSGSYPLYVFPSLETTYRREDLCGGDATGAGYRYTHRASEHNPLAKPHARRDSMLRYADPFGTGTGTGTGTLRVRARSRTRARTREPALHQHALQ